jgi:hypothetical protein
MKLFFKRLAAFFLCLAVISHNHNIAKADGVPTWDWQLPFGLISPPITNAPGEDLHKNRSNEAVDYAGGFFVIAPHDGTVVDVYNNGAPYANGGFGKMVWVRNIGDAGTNLYSMYAHLSNISVTAGQSVKGGETIIGSTGDTGCSANGCGVHLHFEARTNYQQGVWDSGSGVPVRGILGNHFAAQYSPDPNFQNVPSLPSGQSFNLPTNASHSYSNPAQNPDRLLSNVGDTTTTPTARPEVHINFQSFSQNYHVHLGASPSTPGTAWARDFRMAIYRSATGGTLDYYSNNSNIGFMNAQNYGSSFFNGKVTLALWTYGPTSQI